MALKPQDVFVTLKIVSANGARAPYAQLAGELGMSASEVHASVKRAQASCLLHGPEFENRPNYAAVEEFLLHGLKFAFPAERGEPTRGVPTSYAAEPLRNSMAKDDGWAPVWPYSPGKTRGIALEPLHKAAPAAALKDPVFYQYLALADALRDGRARERAIAQQELRKLLEHARSKS